MTRNKKDPAVAGPFRSPQFVPSLGSSYVGAAAKTDIVAPDDHLHVFDARQLVEAGRGPTCRHCGFEAPPLPSQPITGDQPDA